MQSRHVELWYPMRDTFLDDPERAAYEEEAIAHWMAQLGPTLELISPNVSQTSTTIREAPDAVLFALAPRSPLIRLRLYKMAHIKAVVTFDETQRVHPKSERPPEQDFWPVLFSFHLTKAFGIACIAAHLARPGALIFDRGVSVVDGEQIEEVGDRFHLQIVDTAEQLGSDWPILGRPDLVDVAKWFKTISAFSPPVATSRIQRAFAAFTYLVGRHDAGREGELLFRAMQGLEAFYCDGIGDLRKQLADKTQMWLGLSHTPSNIVGKLYDLRSKYVHGSATMPYALSVEDPEEHAPSAMEEFYSGVTLATRLLVATLQRCIAEGVRDVRWEFACRTSGSIE